MTPLPHRYEVRLEGGSSGHGRLAADGLPPLATAPPVEFGGPGDAWSPEHLLLAAVQACFLFTFRAIARAAKLTFERLDVDAVGIVNRDGAATRFTEILLTLRLTVPPGAELEHILRVFDKTEKSCLVSASLSTRIRLEPEIHRTGQAGPVHPSALGSAGLSGT
jgi:organic hydroperoxide reductase OsmC/OhrA